MKLTRKTLQEIRVQLNEVLAKTNIGKKLYAEIQNDYVNTANELGLKAYELQAITWVAWRRIHEIA